MDAYVQTKDLAVGYGGRKPLIRDICLNIQRGEVVALIGPNGAGKSTILKSITCHLDTMGGSVYIGREELKAIPYRDLAKKVSVMLTQPVKPELMTCWEVAASGRYPYTGRMGLFTAEDEAVTTKAMETVHVMELAQRDFASVSDGQRQRVLLARAICQQPELIVLDEPTSYLDIRHKLELLNVLRRMAKAEGITVMMSLHEIDLAQKVADKVVCVKGDTIAQYGPTEEIFTNDLIRDLYDIDQGCYDVTYGSVELPRVEGKPKVFVISGSGSGIPIFRRLQKEGIPFAAGVLWENDLDYPAARALAAQVLTEKPFQPLSKEKVAEAAALMDRCERVLCTRFPVGPGNEGLNALVEKAQTEGKLEYG